MNDINIQFQGFQPSEFTRSYLDTKLSEIHEQSPYGSSLRATFTREQNHLKATIRIMSSTGDFFAIAEGRQFQQVSKQLLSRIRRQLQKWKSRRFEHLSLRDIRVDEVRQEVSHDTGVA